MLLCQGHISIDTKGNINIITELSFLFPIILSQITLLHDLDPFNIFITNTLIYCK